MQALDGDYMTVNETSKYLKIHPKTVLSMIHAGRLEAKKLGIGTNSRFRISSSSIERLVESR
jgi:excisionase family DNA binding protein